MSAGRRPIRSQLRVAELQLVIAARPDEEAEPNTATRVACLDEVAILLVIKDRLRSNVSTSHHRDTAEPSAVK